MSSGSQWSRLLTLCSPRASTRAFSGVPGAKRRISAFPGPTLRRFASSAIVSFAALLDPAAASAHLSRFDVTQDAAGYRIDASADVEADQAVVWETLTDYEKLPQFVPGIHRVRVLETREEAGGQHLVVEQAGELRFLFFTPRIPVLL